MNGASKLQRIRRLALGAKPGIANKFIPWLMLLLGVVAGGCRESQAPASASKSVPVANRELQQGASQAEQDARVNKAVQDARMAQATRDAQAVAEAKQAPVSVPDTSASVSTVPSVPANPPDLLVRRIGQYNSMLDEMEGYLQKQESYDKLRNSVEAIKQSGEFGVKRANLYRQAEPIYIGLSRDQETWRWYRNGRVCRDTQSPFLVDQKLPGGLPYMERLQ